MTFIRESESEADINSVRILFREYAASLGVDLCFQHFEEELAGLPGDYAPPRGCLLLAWKNVALAGCGALRAMGVKDCEMKRMYVRPGFRGCGLGRLLAGRLIAEARRKGYQTIYLDTLASLFQARQLYQSLGFKETTAYYHNPLPDVTFMRLDLGVRHP